MVPLMRTVIGFLVGGALGRLVGALGRFNAVSSRMTRRNFTRNAALSASTLALAGLGAGFVRFFYPNQTGAFGGEVLVPAQQVPTVDDPPVRNAAGRFWLVHSDSGLLALYTKCPHLGCAVPYIASQPSQPFQCPCHGSIYDIHGLVLGGPAPRPMDIMALRVDEDLNVWVNTGDIRQGAESNPDQAVPYSA